MTDTLSRVHCFTISRGGPREPKVDSTGEDDDPLALRPAVPDASARAAARRRDLRRTRDGRIRLALEAPDFQGIMQSLTRYVAWMAARVASHSISHMQLLCVPLMPDLLTFVVCWLVDQGRRCGSLTRGIAP